jgi:hypothetical protein
VLLYTHKHLQQQQQQQRVPQVLTQAYTSLAGVLVQQQQHQ